ncbi:HNH endonuclease [Klebsiella pneumoniae]|nr:HNH endonuclease [Klebsiella pneumoniae]HCR1067272.1 HNH endonuclease [Klebsiella aerogenes]
MLTNRQIDAGFECISPTPTYPDGITKNMLLGRKWSNSSGNVPIFKRHIKDQLRVIQNGRCAYCRRFLGLVSDTDIEHIVEKALFSNFTYEVYNLALSCSECNSAKNQHSQNLKKKLKLPNNVAPFLSTPITAGSTYPSTPKSYRWVHPHFDEYSQNIVISKGWIYKHLTPKGARQIRFLKFNRIGKIEKNFRLERLKARKGKCAKLFYLIAECPYEQLPNLIGELIENLKKN